MPMDREKKTAEKALPEQPPRYQFQQAPDGTFTIFDVPIFAAHSEERGDRTMEFGSAWLQGALNTSLTRQAEGYLPPLHVRHHGDGSVDAAGKFRPTRLGTISHNGEPVVAMFADLVGVRPEIFQRISRGELSYRSVEILDVGKQEIDSLALLDDEVPFFRFPLLRLDEGAAPLNRAAPSAGVPVMAMSHAGPARAYSAQGARSSALFKFNHQENPMPQPNQPVTGAAPATDPTNKAANAEQLLMQIFQMLQQAMGNGQPQQNGPNGQNGPGPVEQPAPAMQQRAPMQIGMSQFAATKATAAEGQTTGQPADDAAQAGANAALMAKFNAVQSELVAMRNAQAVDKRAAGLESKGFSAEMVTEFRARAADPNRGLENALAYADAAEQIGAPSMPPQHWTGELQGEKPDAPELAAYAAKGPKALAEAREFYASWRRSGSELTFDEFYGANSDAEAFLAAGRQQASS